MRETFHIKRGDTSPSLLYALLPVDTDLTGATVRFNMRLNDTGAIKINRAAAVVVTATSTPTVRYDWQPADTGDAGSFSGEFEVTYQGGAVETFPNNSYIPIEITADIA